MPQQPFAKGLAKIQRHDNEDAFAIEPSDLTWNLVSKFGVKSEVYYEGKVNHPALGPLAWRVWQYPWTARNSTETDVGNNTLIEDFNIGLQTD